MLPLLEERFDVLAVDMPGFGRSEPFPPGVDSTPEALADAVEDEMGRAGFDRAHIAGNSLGGWVALELARRGRAETVTAISPAGLQHGREGAWGVAILAELALGGAKRPAAGLPRPEPGRPRPRRRALVHARVEEGPGAPGRGDRAVREQPRLRRHPAARHVRPAARADDARRARADPVGHARRDPAPAPGPPLRAADPRRGAALHPRDRAHADVGRARGAGRGDHGVRARAPAGAPGQLRRPPPARRSGSPRRRRRSSSRSA